VEDIELWFENGRVIREEAAKGKQFLTKFLNTDSRARVLGELGIGTNYDITRFVEHMLFDEKMGGLFIWPLGRVFQRPEERTNQPFTGICCVIWPEVKS